MTNSAIRLVREDLHARLECAEDLAMKYEEWNAADIVAARELIPHLVTVIRGMLVQHKETGAGHCRGCAVPDGADGADGIVDEPWPCPTVQTIHILLKDPQRSFRELAQAAVLPGTSLATTTAVNDAPMAAGPAQPL